MNPGALLMKERGAAAGQPDQYGGDKNDRPDYDEGKEGQNDIQKP